MNRKYPEQMYDVDRYETTPCGKVYILPLQPLKTMVKMIFAEKTKVNLWLSKKDFFNRRERINGLILTTNSILYSFSDTALIEYT